MYDESDLAPNFKTEMDILVGHARDLLTAYRRRNEVSGGDGWVEHEMNKLQESMHCLFGDPAPKAMPPIAPLQSPAASPVRNPVNRSRRHRRLHAYA